MLLFLCACIWRGQICVDNLPLHDGPRSACAGQARIPPRLPDAEALHLLLFGQRLQGVRAEFSYWRAYLLQEQALGVAITGIASNGGSGRGNLTLTLSEHHGANGARRLFRLSGFSLASAAMNGLWKNDAVSAEKKEQQWIRLTVQSETAAAAVAEVLGPGHRVVAVYNLNKQEWVDHLVLQRVVREGGGELSQQELSAVMAEVCGGELRVAGPHSGCLLCGIAACCPASACLQRYAAFTV